MRVGSSRVGLVLRFLLREWRAGELRLLVSAVVLAVGTVTGISLFVDRLSNALLSESATYLAADRVIASSRPVPEEFRAAAAAARYRDRAHVDVPVDGVCRASATNSFRLKPSATDIRCAGVLRLADTPFGPSEPVAELPPPGEVWLDSRLFPALGVEVGDIVTVGVADLRVARVLSDEPDRGGSFFDFGPRLLMRTDDVAAYRSRHARQPHLLSIAARRPG